jgi:methionyl-tRNA formyltransferase
MAKNLNSPIRVIFLSNGGIFPDILLRELLPVHNIKFVGIILSNRVFYKKCSFISGAFRFFLYCGFFYTVYIWLITTFAEFLGFFTKIGSLKFLARKHNIPILRTRDVNSPTSIDFIRNLKPDLLLSAHFDQLLRPPLCDGQEFAAVNIHPSKLPENKGLEPVIYALLNQESDISVTLHRTSKTFDSGRIINTATIKHLPNESVFAITCRLMHSASSIFISSIPNILDRGAGTHQTQFGSYNSWPNPKNIRKLYKMNIPLIRISEFALFFK